MNPERQEHTGMTADHVLAVVAVSDFDTSHDWYRRLFGTDATNVPMPGNLAEWRLTDTGWIQMFHAPEHAGHSLANIAVHDLDAAVDDLPNRGIEAGEVIDANKGVRICSINDPDGNTITMIGNFREHY
jgi:glyoxylase I family protein